MIVMYIYITCILPYEYYMGICILRIVWIFVFILVWGWLGSLLLRIEPRGLYPWDIFSCQWEYLSYILRFVPFLLVLTPLWFLLLISWLFFVLGHIFFFYPDFIYWDWVEFSFDTEDYGHCVGWATVPVLNISFVIYWDVVSCGFILFLQSVRY